jgi:hypothetical protein
MHVVEQIIIKQFNTQRNIFNENISNILENANYKNANNKISFLFNNKSYSILRLTSSFISNCLNIRKEHPHKVVFDPYCRHSGKS